MVRRGARKKVRARFSRALNTMTEILVSILRERGLLKGFIQERSMVSFVFLKDLCSYHVESGLGRIRCGLGRPGSRVLRFVQVRGDAGVDGRWCVWR